jgi:single-strand DNA-binding protein
MPDVNSVVLIGRLTRDAELKYTAGGTAVSKFSLAVNERRKDGDQWKDEAGFFDVVLWGQLGQSLGQYLLKGKQIAVTGRLTQERWMQDGQNRSKIVVTAATVQLLGGTSEGARKQDSAPPAQATRYPTPEQPPANQGWNNPPPSDDGFIDEIPF